jgi:hypothetical protein
MTGCRWHWRVLTGREAPSNVDMRSVKAFWEANTRISCRTIPVAYAMAGAAMSHRFVLVLHLKQSQAREHK